VLVQTFSSTENISKDGVPLSISYRSAGVCQLLKRHLSASLILLQTSSAFMNASASNTSEDITIEGQRSVGSAYDDQALQGVSKLKPETASPF
jgi:hypothetical protein